MIGIGFPHQVLRVIMSNIVISDQLQVYMSVLPFLPVIVMDLSYFPSGHILSSSDVAVASVFRYWQCVLGQCSY
ncbi:hypothetical protein BFS30_02715 [Pedobacter steynii]|uniref:Uncharacterized protein n=1 Tax=Pedobacter steynii TaxID=430522 RepID=A0A1D7QBW8_9SPHI|nr:hypothetical protein BFS30_02715 [Pedobacter steynii]